LFLRITNKVTLHSVLNINADYIGLRIKNSTPLKLSNVVAVALPKPRICMPAFVTKVTIFEVPDGYVVFETVGTQ
jgi:hypothetical protein